MKKVLILAMLLAQASFSFAEDNIHFAPFKATAGYGLDASGDLSGDGAVNIVLNNSDGEEYVGIQFEMNVPAGMPVTFDVDGCTRIKPKKLGKNHHVHTISDAKASVYPGYEKYIVTITDQTDNCAFLGESGDDVMTMYYGVPTTFADGVYPIYMTGVQLIYKSASYKALSDITSYMVVGNPTDQSLVVKGDVPSFVNEALANESAITALDLSAVTSVNGDFTYVAGRNVVAPANDVNASVKFDAPRKGAYGSFCAPVNVDVPCYVFDRAQDGFAFFTEATTAPANTPVLISQDVKTTAQTAVLKGVEGRQISSGYYVASDGSGMRSVNSNAVIPALRGAWDIAAASNLRIAIETPTGIQVIGTADEVFGNTYDLKGRQTTNAKNGVFVVNGKKQFVK